MLLELLKYWLFGKTSNSFFCGLYVLKWPENYKKQITQDWTYCITTLDHAYLEVRSSDVEIDKNDPFLVAGEFSNFAVYGKAMLDERKVTECFYGLREPNSTSSIGGTLLLKPESKLRRLKQAEKVFLEKINVKKRSIL